MRPYCATRTGIIKLVSSAVRCNGIYGNTVLWLRELFFYDHRVVSISPRPHQYAERIEYIAACHHLEEYTQIWHTCYHQTMQISSMTRVRRMISKHGQILGIKFLLTHKNFSARAIMPNWNGTQVEYFSLSQSLVTCSPCEYLSTHATPQMTIGSRIWTNCSVSKPMYFVIHSCKDADSTSKSFQIWENEGKPWMTAIICCRHIRTENAAPFWMRATPWNFSIIENYWDHHEMHGSRPTCLAIISSKTMRLVGRMISNKWTLCSLRCRICTYSFLLPLFHYKNLYGFAAHFWKEDRAHSFLKISIPKKNYFYQLHLFIEYMYICS